MREIKYRAYRMDHGMCEVLALDFADRFVEVLHKGYPVSVLVPFENVKLLEYTGFNDVNGLAIFEDDIVFAQTTYYGDILAHVVYEQGAFGYRPHDCKQINNPERWTEIHPCVDSNGFNICDFYSFSGGYSSIDILSMEVAGNIHDNPEPVESIPF